MADVLLQRRRNGRWRTVLSVDLDLVEELSALVAMAAGIDASVAWRLATNEPAPTIMTWDGARWIDAPGDQPP